MNVHPRRAAHWLELPRVPRDLDPAATLRAMGRIYAREAVLASATVVVSGPLMLATRALPTGISLAAYLVVAGIGICVLCRFVAALEGYWRVSGQWGNARQAHGLAPQAPGRWIALLRAFSWVLIQVLDSTMPSAHGWLATFQPWPYVLLVQGMATVLSVMRVLAVSRVPWPLPRLGKPSVGAVQPRYAITAIDVLSDRALLFAGSSAVAAVLFGIGVPVLLTTDGERGALGVATGLLAGGFALFCGAAAEDEARRLRPGLDGVRRRGASLLGAAGLLAILGDGAAALMALIWVPAFADVGTPVAFAAPWILLAALGLIIAPVIADIGLWDLRRSARGPIAAAAGSAAAVDSDTLPPRP